MKITVAGPKPCFSLFHRWQVISDNGFTTYLQCKRCSARRVQQPENGGKQPVDAKWLVGLNHSGGE